MKRADWVVLIAIFFVGTLLRVDQLTQIPPGLYHDEAYSGLDALGILRGAGLPIFFEGNGGREPFFIYLHALSIFFFGTSVFALRLPAAFIGIATLAAFYALVRAMNPVRGKSIALIATAGLAVLYWHLNFSRMGWRTVSLPFFECLAFYFFFRARRTFVLRDQILAGVFLGVGLYTYLSARFIPIVIALFWLMELFFIRRDRPAIRFFVKHAFILVAAAFVVFLPLAFYFFQYPQALLLRVSDVSLASNRNLAGAIWENAQRVAAIFYSDGDPEWRHGIAHRPLLDWVMGIPFALGLVVALLRAKQPKARFALIWLGVMFLPTVLSKDAPDTQRAIGAVPVIALFIAWGVDFVLGFATRSGRVTFERVAIIATIVLLLGSGLISYRDYFWVWANDRHAYDDYQGYLADFARWVNTQPGNVLVPMDVYAEPAFNFLTGTRFARTNSTVNMSDAEKKNIFNEPATVVLTQGFNAPFALLRRDTAIFLDPADASAKNFDPSTGMIWKDKFSRPLAALFPLTNGIPSPNAIRYSALNVDIDHRMNLLGYNAPRIIAPGNPYTVTLYWSAQKPTQDEVKLFVHLLNTDGENIAGTDNYPANGYRLNLWQPGLATPDQHVLNIDPGLESGKYNLEIGMYRAVNGVRLTTWVNGVRATDDRVILGPLKAVLKAEGVAPPEHQLNTQFGDAIILRGVTLGALQLTRGSALPLRLYWRASQRIERDYTVFVHLLDTNNRLVAQTDAQPRSGKYPTSIWDADENVYDNISIPIPATLTPGSYRIAIGVYDSQTQQRLPVAPANGAMPGAVLLDTIFTVN